MSDSDFEDDPQERKGPDVIVTPTHYIEEGNMSLFRDRFSIICGVSKTGKTFFVQSILNDLRKSVPNFIVVTPTRDFYKGLLPDSNIWETLTEQSINDIYQRQESAKSVRSITDKIEVLHLIHTIIAPSQAEPFLIEMKKRGLTEEQCVKMLRTRLGSGKLEFQEKVKQALMAKMIAMETAGDAARTKAGKGSTATMAAAVAAIKAAGVDPGEFGPDDFRPGKKERFNVYTALGIPEKSFKENPPLEVLKTIYNGYAFIDLDYSLVLVLDDVTADLRRFTGYAILPKDPFEAKKTKASEKKSIFLELSTRNRHYSLTVVLVTHNYLSIVPSVRSTANVYLFTHKEAFDSAMPEISSEDFIANKKHNFVNKVFTKKDENGDSFTKLLYFRPDNDTGPDGQSKKVKYLNAVQGDMEVVETTRVIDDLISKHSNKEGTGSYNF